MPYGRIENGLVQVYTGHGKGKTTAALGLAMRAAGHGYKVRVIQFMKGTGYYGELAAASRLGPELEIRHFGRDCPFSESIASGEMKCTGCGACFVKKGEVTTKDIEMAAEALILSMATIKNAEADIAILDEIGNAIYFDLVLIEDCVRLIQAKPAGVELVLTGRNMPQEIIEMADLVTEMKLVKHPFATGVPARRGIEY